VHFGVSPWKEMKIAVLESRLQSPSATRLQVRSPNLSESRFGKMVLVLLLVATLESRVRSRRKKMQMVQY
jgi:hypothetical protein